jgi:hypothetical protein
MGPDAAELDPANLSSGEKALLNLALLGYACHVRRINSVSGPELLLFDEFDSLLHPGILDTFFWLIDEVLLKENGIKSIIATHSPSTVSLAPVGADLFEVNLRQAAIERVSRARAISNLCAGFISITSRKRIILVEDDDDEEFFQAAYEFLRKREDFVGRLDLIFQSVASGKKKYGIDVPPGSRTKGGGGGGTGQISKIVRILGEDDLSPPFADSATEI